MEKTNNGGIFNYSDIAEIDCIAKSNAEFEFEAKKELSQPQPTQPTGWDSLEE